MMVRVTITMVCPDVFALMALEGTDVGLVSTRASGRQHKIYLFLQTGEESPLDNDIETFCSMFLFNVCTESFFIYRE